MRGRSAAFTLVEVLVASALASVVLSLVVQLLIPALRAWTDGQKRSEVGQSLLVTTSWLGEDVLRSSPSSLRLIGEHALVMKCAAGQTVDHNNPFSQAVGYWLEDGQIFRSTRTLADPEAELPPLVLDELKAMPDKRRVATNVTTFEIVIPQPWRIDLRLAVDKHGRKGEVKTAYSSIYAPFDLEMAAENAIPPAQP